MNFLDNLYLGAKLRMEQFFIEMKEDERGVSNLVGTILLIVIVVALAALLWGWLSGWFKELWDKIVNTGNTVGQSTGG